MSYLTIPEVARRLGTNEANARKAVDSLGARVPRAGGYRIVSEELLPQIADQLNRRRRPLAKESVTCD